MHQVFGRVKIFQYLGMIRIIAVHILLLYEQFCFVLYEDQPILAVGS
jgi:hypothetical protein